MTDEIGPYDETRWDELMKRAETREREILESQHKRGHYALPEEPCRIAEKEVNGRYSQRDLRTDPRNRI